ncbi:FAD-binding oxidoreductase [Sulfitobacter mediterraneus]|uniref:FAD-dependent oxidoreductase n=1 Tax=Sulfitobacter mediterraneus TaxID=83219 RepID=A0A061SWW0_9RHOB|nr:FAD-binding oxidoreductase [Sulfitobacter mediterraneus]KAJ04200.1 FAD-dependent oxidoreductase [Sulfitobacter mediterraneus]KIN76046.1 FAD dependent oxidoreductase [Sulfitobacter mediterraneus KCTC 32188]MBM1311102.1 FAD-binding oxidoreductase [Sulfitobacter mediterraneus]MBM1314984.1 FAD-binding oxidoreductase [Sulfitobacter mediterraneus]MBM1323345.1 FAD-binding oxidoreductase [Sulfitobacter mediterraneus]
MSKLQAPAHQNYDVVIVGGAIMGSSAAWFLSKDKDFDGRILVVERDPTYQNSSTMHTNSCMRQQFSTQLNVKISQFAAEFVKNLREYMGGDTRVPDLGIRSFGYMYLADNDGFADVLRENQKIQHAAGAATQLMTRDEIAQAYPFYNLDDIVLGSINLVDEGYWDGTAVFDCQRRAAKEAGVEYIQNEVVAITKNAAGTQVESVTLSSGEIVSCGQVLNASGPRANRTAQMAGIEIPVEPRKRFTWIFTAEKPLDRDLPLTIDPSGVHVRENGGGTYQAGGHADIDPAVDFDDFAMDHSIWENHIWPTLATRIPQFEAIKVQSEWAGHYSYNTFDHNAILGPHDEVSNFFFLNGFSGHGLQQSPAMGRGTAEIMLHGNYKTLDLSEFHFNRIGQNRPVSEKAVI